VDESSADSVGTLIGGPTGRDASIWDTPMEETIDEASVKGSEGILVGGSACRDTTSVCGTSVEETVDEGSVYVGAKDLDAVDVG